SRNPVSQRNRVSQAEVKKPGFSFLSRKGGAGLFISSWGVDDLQRSRSQETRFLKETGFLRRRSRNPVSRFSAERVGRVYSYP
ncbi:hypothetical protein, partial [Limnospira sp. PMC 1042.18]|uniref:hypothetical protein n=1 Tax=Limnospira sp. PMC 1042.18 TaxID=2981018 RepID=UPI0028E0D753